MEIDGLARSRAKHEATDTAGTWHIIMHDALDRNADLTRSIAEMERDAPTPPAAEKVAEPTAREKRLEALLRRVTECMIFDTHFTSVHHPTLAQIVMDARAELGRGQ